MGWESLGCHLEVRHLTDELGTQPWHRGVNQLTFTFKQEKVQNKAGKELKENFRYSLSRQAHLGPSIE